MTHHSLVRRAADYYIIYCPCAACDHYLIGVASSMYTHECDEMWLKYVNFHAKGEENPTDWAFFQQLLLLLDSEAIYMQINPFNKYLLNSMLK